MSTDIPMLDFTTVSDIVRRSLAEDVGSGDVTTLSTVNSNLMASGRFVAEGEGILAGWPVALEVFRQLDPNCHANDSSYEGQTITKGLIAAQLTGSAQALLTGERVALNFLQHLSGIASLTNKFTCLIEGTEARIFDTRKTTPGLRVLEKYAVRVGGGSNHRFGLYDAVLIKDNHIALAGGVEQAIERVRIDAHQLQVEVECDTLAQVEEALKCGADIILLDNMSTQMLESAVKMADGKALLEASGGVHLDTVREISLTGVDRISVGALTHSAPILPMRFECYII
jgi:nicotinate-nucleotide pyrophosphorylase (carboxylating)